MKKGRILNKDLSTAIASLGHMDCIIISDAGLPVVNESQRIDLSIEQDLPTIPQILDLVTSDLIYEKCIVAEEQKEYNPYLFKKVNSLIDRCPVETIPHEELLKYREKAKYIIRTGSFEPWGNVVLICGVDAPVWFKKPGTSSPDYYKSRVSYKEKKDE